MVDPDATVPSNCSADGAGLVSAVAGEPAHFTILKKDRSGQPRTRGVDHFYADVRGPGRWDCEIVDERDGSYSVTYVAKAAGSYQLDVGLAPMNGPIAGSPFSIVVAPGKPHAALATYVTECEPSRSSTISQSHRPGPRTSA